MSRKSFFFHNYFPAIGNDNAFTDIVCSNALILWKMATHCFRYCSVGLCMEVFSFEKWWGFKENLFLKRRRYSKFIQRGISLRCFENEGNGFICWINLYFYICINFILVASIVCDFLFLFNFTSRILLFTFLKCTFLTPGFIFSLINISYFI